LNAGWTPLALLCARRFLERRSWRWLSGFIAAAVMQCWVSLTLGAFLLIMLALLGPAVLWRAARRSPYRLGVGALATVVAIGITQGPIALKYHAAQRAQGHVRTWIENVIDSADPVGYVAAPRSHPLLGRWTSGVTRAERWLYPGLVATTLALTGVFAGMGSRTPPSSWRRDAAVAAIFLAAAAARAADTGRPVDVFSWSRLLMSASIGLVAWHLWRRLALHRFFDPASAGERAFYTAWTLVAALLSLGPVLLVNARAIAYAPYAALYLFVPGLNALRAPVRFHVFVMLGLSILAGYGVSTLLDGRRPRARVVSAAILAMAILADSLPWPVPSVVVDDLHPQRALERWLASQPGEIVFAELPIAPDGDLWRECDATFSSIYHRKRIVNGYSGFWPGGQRWLWTETQRAGLSEPALRYLDRAGVHYIGVRSGTPIAPAAASRLARVGAFDDVTVYGLVRRSTTIVP
jgi:hypothetical protein